MLYPDLGLYLISKGTQRETELHYYSVPVSHLSVLGRELYGFTTNIGGPEGVEHCASFDFNKNILNQILARAPEEKRNEFLAQSGSVGTTVEFSEHIRIDHIKAGLGDLQHGQREDFVPLVITEVS